MSNLIAVWGAPCSGKTTIAVKLAWQLAKQGYQVVVLNLDTITPVLPILFPNRQAEELYSVGTALSQVEVTKEGLAKQMVVCKAQPNIGFLGFKDGENDFTYPKVSPTKLEALFTCLEQLAEVVIVDCSSRLDAVGTGYALQQADVVIRLTTATTNSLSFFASQLPLLHKPEYEVDRHCCCLNIPDQTVYVPTNQALHRCNTGVACVPHCATVNHQYRSGELLVRTADKKFEKAMQALAELVVRHD